MAPPASPGPTTSPPPASRPASAPATATAPAPTAAAPSQAPTADRLTVTLSGDLLWHDGLVRDAAAAGKRSGVAFDFAPVLAEVKPIVEAADVSVCHIEVPIAPSGTPYAGYPRFASPAQTLTAVRGAGFDYCTTASNHAWDQGEPGVRATLSGLDAQGIVHSGSSRTTAEAATPRVLTTASGIRFAVIAGTYGHNRAPSAAWPVDALDADAMIARGKAARAAGADVVLAAMHAGTEYRLLPNAQQVSVATRLASSGVFDLVYGHHAHVPQPWTKVAGTWVMYGGGNLVAQMRVATPRAYDAYLGRVTFERRGDRFAVSTAEYVPLLMTLSRAGQPARVLPVNASLAAGVGDKARLEVARARVREAVSALGVEGLTEA